MKATIITWTCTAISITCAIISLYYSMNLRKMYTERATLLSDHMMLKINIHRLIRDYRGDDKLRADILKLLDKRLLGGGGMSEESTRCDACGKLLDIERVVEGSTILCADCFFERKK